MSGDSKTKAGEGETKVTGPEERQEPSTKNPNLETTRQQHHPARHRSKGAPTMKTSTISESIKRTVRDVVMLSAAAKAERICQIKEVKQSDAYLALPRMQRHAYLTTQGFTPTQITLAATLSPAQIIERMNKEAERSLLKIDVAVAKKLAAVEVDKVELVHCGSGKDGFIEGAWFITDTEGKTRTFSFETTYAGGYNIQCLHVRTLYSLSRPV